MLSLVISISVVLVIFCKEGYLKAFRAKVHYNARLQELYFEDNELHFKVYIVSTREEAYELEQQMLNEVISDPLCLNIGKDVRSPNLGRTFSASTREKLASRRGEKHHTFGKSFTQEHRDRIGEKHRGKVLSAETKARISKSKTGNSAWTPEQRAQASIRRKGLRTGDKNPSSKKASVDGVIFSSAAEVSRTLGIPKGIVERRLRGDAKGFPTWFYVK